MKYTLYFVNVPMGYFERSQIFDALNDEVALAIAGRQAGAQPLELWCGGRLVGRFEAHAPAETSSPSEAAA